MTKSEINTAVARGLGWQQIKSGHFMGWWQSPTVKILEDDRFPEEGADISSRSPGVRPYCTDISAAWEVVESLDNFNLMRTPSGKGFTAIIYPNNMPAITSEADTAPMAICMAFLRVDNLSGKRKGVEN